MMRRLGIGIAAGAAFMVATGLWAPAYAALEYGIDSPPNGDVIGHRSVAVKTRASSDSSSGIQYMRLEVHEPSGRGSIAWCAPGPAPQCPSWSSGQTQEYQGTYTWNVGSMPNGEYLLNLLVKEHGSSSPLNVSHTVKLNVPPVTPDWSSITSSMSGGRPVVSLKWRANSEPDIVSYQITRSSSNGGASQFFRVNAANPSAQGCSVSGGTYTCTDSAFGQSGYGGRYTYYLSATRSSPVSSSGVSSQQSARTTTVNEPRPTQGTGGNNSGGGARPYNPGGGAGPGFTPIPGTLTPTPGGPPPSPDPFAVDPSEFYEGSFDKSLPYKDRVRVQVEGVKTRRAAGFAEEAAEVTDPRKMLVPVAGGLFFVIAAMHFRRILRDS